MCGIVKAIFGGGEKSAPPVVYQSPKADQAAVEAEASGVAAQDRTRRRRSVRASSLLATGGQGDTATSPVTGSPAAAGKQTLGG
jgi:hypothetical protein